jgi:hypothetical protein
MAWRTGTARVRNPDARLAEDAGHVAYRGLFCDDQLSRRRFLRHHSTVFTQDVYLDMTFS